MYKKFAESEDLIVFATDNSWMIEIKDFFYKEQYSNLDFLQTGYIHLKDWSELISTVKMLESYKLVIPDIMGL